MDVLEYTRNGLYTVKISTTDIGFAWDKFRVRVKDAATYCKYEFHNDGVLRLYDYELHKLTEVGRDDWGSSHPVMFETNAYTISITFTDVKFDEGYEPYIAHQSREVEEMFQSIRLHEAYLISSSVNFLNQPGKFAIDIVYTTTDGINHKDTVAFDVVSPKLDTKTDLNTIIREIKAEYGNLVFRYLTLTFQQFEFGNEANNELIWLSVFKQVIDSYVMAVRYILNKPHNQTITNVEYRMAERIKHWTPALEDTFGNDRCSDAEKALRKHYRIEVAEATNDTRENRFVKYTLERMSERLRTVIGKIKSDDTSDNEITLLRGKLDELQKMQNSPFFRTIGRFDGFKQESLVMQQRQGYSQVYRYWLMLQNGLDLIDGNTSVSVQPIWKLYELWCFLKVKNTICDIMGIDIHKADDQKYIQKHESDSYDPFNGGDLTGSVDLHYKDNEDDYVEVGYQYIFDRKKQRINNATSVTVEQKPDIVVNIHRKNRNFVMTYLFDAKYRVNGDDDNTNNSAVDEPVPDTLNQMHRYRDAIYYGQKSEGNFAKEVIGAYILFPGRLNEEGCINGEVNKPYYLKSIDEVNIGAFPLLPNDKSGLLLREHLKQIIIGDNVIDTLVKESVPQKGLQYTDEKVSQGTYFLSTIDLHVNSNKDDLINGIADSFVSGYSALLGGIDFQKIKYLAIVDNHKVSGYYEVEKVMAVDMSDVLNKQEKKGSYKGYDKPYRVNFSLSVYKKLPQPFVYGLDANASKGVAISRKEFQNYMK